MVLIIKPKLDEILQEINIHKKVIVNEQNS